jgi:hypothetical protein
MDRRRFLLTSLAGALAAPLAAEAQRAEEVYRVGVLWLTYRHVSAPSFTAFRDGLSALGHRSAMRKGRTLYWICLGPTGTRIGTQSSDRRLSIVVRRRA